MNEDKKQLVARYAEIEKQNEANAKEQAEIKKVLLEEMTKLGADQIKADVGMFYFRTTKKWNYPVSVCEIEAQANLTIAPLQSTIESELEKVKIAKKEAEENGTATAEEKKSLAFKAN
jgi:hypothetical protein